jgi:hypothetical protein
MEKPLRVLLAIRPPLFCETLGVALRKCLTKRADVVVVKNVRDSKAVQEWARKYKADVVIATLEPTQDVPKLVTELLARFPRILVVGIPAQQESVRTYRLAVRTLADSSVEAIGNAVQQRPEKSNGVG